MSIHQPSDLADFYQRQLQDDILPFWLTHAPDRECGGYFTCLDRDGSVYDPNKLCMWGQGRMAWTFAWLFNEWRQEEEWLEFARLGIDFLTKHAFSPSGRMYYATLRDGTPLQPGADYHSELSAILAFNEVARATGDAALRARARQLFDRVWSIIRDPGGDWNPFLPGSLPHHQYGYCMIPLNVLQQLRATGEEPEDAQRIDQCIDAMMRLHFRPDLGLVLENVAEDGSVLPGTLGRRVNPGHMIEGGTFLIHEARHRGDHGLSQSGLDLIRRGFEIGWDGEYGGIFNDLDCDGKPIPGQQGFVAPSKLWWQHAEALYGLALAHAESGDAWFWDNYLKVHDYSFSHFADREYGEWYANLDRSGKPVNRVKGTDRKNTFHIVRNFHWCAQLTFTQPGSVAKG